VCAQGGNPGGVHGYSGPSQAFSFGPGVPEASFYALGDQGCAQAQRRVPFLCHAPRATISHMPAQSRRKTASVQESLLECAIRSRKRMYKAQRANGSPSETQNQQFFLNIERSDVEFIKHEVWTDFFAGARIPRTVEVDFDRILSSREMPSAGAEDSLTLALTQEYAISISRAAGRVADCLMTAAISRTARIRVTARAREAIWRECLGFAAQLGQWNAFATWADRVVRVSWQPTTKDGALDRDQISRAVERRRAFFEERIGMYWREWLSAIDRKIDLRRILSSGRSTRTGREGGLESVIRIIKEKNPRYTQRKIAGGVDDIFSTTLRRPTPILRSWKTHGASSLVEAYDHPKTNGRVKKYISDVT
jgi:hypothetical protein